jgi:hypothetical protein
MSNKYSHKTRKMPLPREPDGVARPVSARNARRLAAKQVPKIKHSDLQSAATSPISEVEDNPNVQKPTGR